MFKNKIEINQFKKSHFVLTFETSDFGQSRLTRKARDHGYMIRITQWKKREKKVGKLISNKPNVKGKSILKNNQEKK